MDAASFLSSVIEVAIGIAGFAGIVAAIRQRGINSWAPDQIVLLHILFTASAAAIAFGLLPPLLNEAGLEEGIVWKISSTLLICWLLGALWFRRSQCRALGVTMQIPRHVLGWATVALVLQIYNIVELGKSWPYLFGITTMLLNGFSVFLLLILRPTDD